MTHLDPRQFAGSSPVESNPQTQLDAALPLGTTVLTLDGALPVEAIYPGDRVITRNGGAQTVRAVIRRAVPRSLRLVHVGKDALGGKPEEDVILLPQQRVLIRDWRAQALYGKPQAELEAEQLVDGEFIKWADGHARPSHMIALHFDKDQIIYAGGLELCAAAPYVEAVTGAF